MKDLETPFMESKYKVCRWPSFEAMSDGVCEGCGEPFSDTHPMGLAAKCHKHKGVMVHYWNGYLYFSCPECGKPICKVEISKALI